MKIRGACDTSCTKHFYFLSSVFLFYSPLSLFLFLNVHTYRSSFLQMRIVSSVTKDKGSKSFFDFRFLIVPRVHHVFSPAVERTQVNFVFRQWKELLNGEN